MKITAKVIDKHLMPYDVSNPFPVRLESRDPLYQDVLYTCEVPVPETIGNIKVGTVFNNTPIGEIVASLLGRDDLGSVSIESTLNRILYGSHDKPNTPGIPPLKPIPKYKVYYGFAAGAPDADETTNAKDVVKYALENESAFAEFGSFEAQLTSDLVRDIHIVNRESKIFGLPVLIIPNSIELPLFITGLGCTSILKPIEYVEINETQYGIYSAFEYADTIAEYTYKAHK